MIRFIMILDKRLISMRSFSATVFSIDGTITWNESFRIE